LVRKSKPPTLAKTITTITIDGIKLDLELTMLPPEDVNSNPYVTDINLALKEIYGSKQSKMDYL
jgi:hypothetical protein